MKRLLFFIFVFMTVALNAQTPWNGTTEEWTKGEGTAEDPFQIETAEQLAHLSKLANEGNILEADHFKLMNDLDMSGAPSQTPRQKWTPIGTYNNSFRSKFDGGGHTIANLYVEMDDSYAEIFTNQLYAGLFGHLMRSDVRNVGIVGESSISSTGAYIGSIAGLNFDSQITNCHSNATISGAMTNTGGIAGRSEGIIFNCYNTGNVTSKGNFVGGITGYSAAGKVVNCYNSGAISGSAAYVGGISGCNTRNIENCYNIGTVAITGGKTLVGGITSYDNSGGLLKNCHKLGGKVTIDGVVSDGFAAGEVKTEAEMKAAEFITALNAEQEVTVWFADSKNVNAGYPILKYQIQYVITVTAGENGTVTGGGTYSNGSQVTLTATPNAGYKFVKWNDGNVEATRVITVIADATYTAEFAPIKYTLTVTAGENGTVAGGGEYDYNTDATLTATANTGYRFSKWSDGNTENPRKVRVTADATYAAEFVINKYTITVVASANGTATGGGEYDYNSEATLTASADTDYIFAQWSDGNTENPRKVIVTSDATYTAEFAEHKGVTSTEDIGVRIYPNPMTTKLTIEGDFTSIELYNSSGKLVFSTNNASTIDVSRLSHGVYIIKAYNNDKVGTYKVIK